MKVTSDINFSDFAAWQGAVDTQRTICDNNKENEFESLLEDIFPEGMTDTELNDYLWFESDSIFEMLGITDEMEEEDVDDNDEEN